MDNDMQVGNDIYLDKIKLICVSLKEIKVYKKYFGRKTFYRLNCLYNNKDCVLYVDKILDYYKIISNWFKVTNRDKNGFNELLDDCNTFLIYKRSKNYNPFYSMLYNDLSTNTDIECLSYKG